jgi:hypothetical protein
VIVESGIKENEAVALTKPSLSMISNKIFLPADSLIQEDIQ